MNIVGASGSAIFFTGSSVAKFDITFPSWSVDDQKNYYEYSVGANLLTSYYPPKYGRASYLTGSAIAGGSYIGFITAPNGNIYAIPSTASGSVKFNTTGSSSGFTYITTSSLNAGNAPKFGGAALAGNGCIYMVPYGTGAGLPYKSVFKINTNTDQISYLGDVAGDSGVVMYIGAVCAPNGSIYAIPHSALNVLKINPKDDTIFQFGSVIGSGNPNAPPFHNGVLAPNGVIYCAPRDYGLVLKIDTNTDTLSTVNIGLPNAGNSNRWNGGVLAPNNQCIYFIPNQATGSLKIDPRTDQITFINLGFAPGNQGGIVGPDGLIYGNQPTNGGNRVVINPFNDTISVVPAVNGANYGSALGFNGKIYSINAATNRLYVLEDNRTYDLDPNYVLSRYRNKI